MEEPTRHIDYDSGKFLQIRLVLCWQKGGRQTHPPRWTNGYDTRATVESSQASRRGGSVRRIA
jgi:hypothetical protein